MQLRCGACGGNFESGEAASRSGLARCTYCGVITELSAPRGREATEAKPVERPEVPLPLGWDLARDGDALRLTWRWRSGKAVAFAVLAFLGLAWGAGFVAWGAAKRESLILLAGIFNSVGALGFSYYALAMLCNRSAVAASVRGLVVHHGPVPWLGNLARETKDIEQLYTRERVQHLKEGGIQRTYEVLALLRGGKQVKVLSGLEEVGQALFVEQRLEKHLGIADRRVPGESGR